MAARQVRRLSGPTSRPSAKDAFIVAAVEPSRDLVLTVPDGRGGSAIAWEHFLQPMDGGRTRLIARGRASSDWLDLARARPPTGHRRLFIERAYAGLARLPRLLIIGFPLHAQRSLEADIPERFNEAWNPHRPLPQRTFHTQRAGNSGRGPVAVLAMHGNHQRSQFLERSNRFISAIKNQVGRVEVDPQIGAVHVVNEFQQHVSRFLAGFQREGLPMPGGMFAHLPHHLADGDVIRMRRILRHKADVACDARHAELRRKIADSQSSRQAQSARLRRDEPHATSDGRNISVSFPS